MKLDTIIIEDKCDLRMILKDILTDIPYIDLVGESDNGDTGHQLIVNRKPRIVFLDIEIPGMNGLQIANSIAEMNETHPKTPINTIFATGYEEFALDAFKYYAFDYLIKPYSKERIRSTLDRIYNSTVGIANKAQEKIIVKTEAGAALIDPDKIIVITKKSRISTLYTKDSTISASESLETFERYLEDKPFLRCHKSTIVNLTKIKGIRPHNRTSLILDMEDIEETVFISKKKLAELKGYFT